jgi:PAS domain S-box-containing protein
MDNDFIQMPKQADILVVDDSVKSLKLLVDLLSSEGYRVRPAANGNMALRSAAESIPDLILLDVKMPGMDGYEVCSRLKGDEKLRQIPIIFISGIEKTYSKIKGFDAGGIDYITKPFHSEEVLARVRIHLELRSLQVQLEQRVHARTVELTHACQALQASEIRFRDLFENSPVSLWEGDLSKVKAFIESLKNQKVGDFKAYLDKHPDTVMRCAKQIVLFDVNRAAVELFGGPDKQTLIEGLANIFTTASREAFTHLLLSIWDGETKMEQEAVFTRLNGEQRFVRINWSVSPGQEQTFSRLVISIVDITAQKQSEEKIKRQLAELRAWQNTILDREDRVQELKREVNEQLERLGEPIRYPSQQKIPE